jgi:hypothetical protein
MLAKHISQSKAEEDQVTAATLHATVFSLTKT